MMQARPHPGQPAVIVVDLDRTVTLADTLHESALGMLRGQPWRVFTLPWLLWRSRRGLRAAVGERTGPDVTLLPYNSPLVDWLRAQQADGRRIVLRTTGSVRTARSVAEHLGLGDAEIAAEGSAAPGGGAAPSSAADRTQAAAAFPRRRLTMGDCRRVLRVHQWLKNLLLAVPLLAAHRAHDPAALHLLLVAFIAFSLCASAAYVVNDLIDLESDRRHPRKRHRPFAAGVLSVRAGVVLAPALAAAGFALGSLAGPAFLVTLGAYTAVSLAYSALLKRHALVDCLTLAGLYTLRIVAGGAAVAIMPSFWLLTFSVFIFLSLAFLKRYAELQALATAGRRDAPGRGYAVSDSPLVLAFGVTSGQAAVLVLALYLQSDTVIALYRAPQLIWCAVPLLLFWVSWAWLKAHRGEMHDDPVVFAVQDPTSRAVALLLAATFVLAAAGLGG